MGMASNHATLDPFTGGGFNDDSTNDLGINSSSDQWVHIAMVWNGTNLITYVNGLPKITTAGSGVTMLATAQSVLILGCNPTNNNCFNGLFDELRIWKVARTATRDPRQLQQAGRDRQRRPGRLLEVRRDVRHHHRRRRHHGRPHRAQRHPEGHDDRAEPDVRRADRAAAARLPLTDRAR